MLNIIEDGDSGQSERIQVSKVFWLGKSTKVGPHFDLREREEFPQLNLPQDFLFQKPLYFASENKMISVLRNLGFLQTQMLSTIF